MPSTPDSPYRVPFDGSFRVSEAPTVPPAGTPGKRELERELADQVDRLRELQRMLYAHDRYAALLVFQALDAAGKDGTIRAVMSGVNPAGCQVFSFKQPSAEELDHDFLWRCAKRMPERGRIGVFNRSYYEEVLVVRVHPDLLAAQRLPGPPPLAELWERRYASIRGFEEHAAASGTLILKFWLNVSEDEQRERFLKRIDEPEKNWKFSEADVAERKHWGAYLAAYEDTLRETSRSHAPWYAIPADDKRYMRLTVARLVADAIEGLGVHFPVVDDAARERFQRLRHQLAED